MAIRRSSRFDANVNQQLLSLLESVGKDYAPYDVELLSGYAPRPTRPGSMHPRHGAVDVNLIDRKTGAALPNVRDPASAAAYQAFANAAYQAADPELQKQLRWGGYFEQGVPKDWMHFDVGGADRMQAGSWAGGFKPEVMKQLQLASAGGLGPEAQAQAQATIAAAPPDVQRAFLSTIAGTEAPGYDVLYGGGKFTDYAQHPNARIPIHKGPNAGDYSTAAGRYQMLHGTWGEAQKALGLKDFSPGSQDEAAWWLAQRDYKARTGGDLQEALQSGDPGRINAAAAALSKTWTSLPGGIEQAKGYGTGTFADAFSKNLGTGGPRGPVEAAGGGAGNEAGAGATPAVGASPAQPAWKKLLADMGKSSAAMGGVTPGRSMIKPVPEAARIDQPEVPTIDPQQVEMQRQQLAAALARLNSGRLA